MRGFKLLYVTPRFYPSIGGVENHVDQVSRRLVKAGVEVHVLTADASGKLPEQEQIGGVNIHRALAWPADKDYFFAPDIYHIIYQHDWDLIHIQSYHTFVAPIGMLAAWRAKIPYVVTFHGGGHSSSLRNAMRGLQQAALRPLLSRADRLVAIAKFEIDYYSKKLGLPRERFAYIPNGADLPVVQKSRSSTKNGTLIASIGRLERYKGHQRILAALPHILKHKPEARLWIAGSGPYEGELRRIAEKLQVADRVEIRAIPAKERQRMANELSKTSLVVLLSEYETHPIAILEALALGRPALVARTSGLQELAEKGWASSIALESSSEEISLAVMEQLENPIVPSELDLFTWDDCAKGLLELYQSILWGE